MELEESHTEEEGGSGGEESIMAETCGGSTSTKRKRRASSLQNQWIQEQMMIRKQQHQVTSSEMQHFDPMNCPSQKVQKQVGRNESLLGVKSVNIPSSYAIASPPIETDAHSTNFTFETTSYSSMHQSNDEKSSVSIADSKMSAMEGKPNILAQWNRQNGGMFHRSSTASAASSEAGGISDYMQQQLIIRDRLLQQSSHQRDNKAILQRPTKRLSLGNEANDHKSSSSNGTCSLLGASKSWSQDRRSYTEQQRLVQRRGQSEEKVVQHYELQISQQTDLGKMFGERQYHLPIDEMKLESEVTSKASGTESRHKFSKTETELTERGRTEKDGDSLFGGSAGGGSLASASSSIRSVTFAPSVGGGHGVRGQRRNSVQSFSGRGMPKSEETIASFGENSLKRVIEEDHDNPNTVNRRRDSTPGEREALVRSPEETTPSRNTATLGRLSSMQKIIAGANKGPSHCIISNLESELMESDSHCSAHAAAAMADGGQHAGGAAHTAISDNVFSRGASNAEVDTKKHCTSRQSSHDPFTAIPTIAMRQYTSNVWTYDDFTLSTIGTASRADRQFRSREVISNMEALHENTSYVSDHMDAASKAVIASIEADVSKMEEKEEEEAANDLQRARFHALPNNPRMVLGPYGTSVRSTSSHNSNMVAAFHQQQRQQIPQNCISEAARYNLADQISNLAINDDDDSASIKSIVSFDSYDGKITNITAMRVQTQEHELACIELNNAIVDLYGAPVRKILAKFPIVTRFIRADDDTGNIQLHYAVRNGNVKAIRRMLRADPECALIRNNQGYCPLHFAVQMGNFAAVQALCSLVPACAEVQCEEGCLPLHEAVSSAAHQPDAPQITAVLLNAFPAAIKITNDEGLLPLHLAAMSGFSAGIRTIFAYGFSTIYARENTDNMLPLDFAVKGYFDLAGMDISDDDSDDENNNVQMQVGGEGLARLTNHLRSDQSTRTEQSSDQERFWACIDILLASALYDRPVLMSSRNGRLFLPLHGAAAAQPRRSTWKIIWKRYGVDHAGDVDVRGQTSLHILASSKIIDADLGAEMVSDINALDLDATTTMDDSGLIPLHVALISNAPYLVVKQLLECNKSCVTMEVDEDCDHAQYRRMLPFQLAAANGCDVDVIDLLLRTYPVGVAGFEH